MLLVLVVIASIAFYFLYYVPQRYWKDKNVPTVKPLPIVGHLLSTLVRTEQMGVAIQRLYNTFPNSRYFGVFNFLTPVLVIRDPQLVKRIAIKDFETFPEHPGFSSEEVDPLWAKNLLAVQGLDKWRRMRATLSPSFTSSKMRMMFSLMNKCAENFVSYYYQNEGVVKVDMKEAFSRYANDVIASTAFGITVDSLADKTNEFFKMGKDVSNFNGIRALKFFMYSISPALSKLLHITVFSKESSSFFRKIIKDNIQMREKENISRPDMIHLLLEARKGRNNHETTESVADSGFAVVEEFVKGETGAQTKITDDDITAQAMIFFLAGFDTVSTLMGFASMELATHPEIQKRLAQEIADLNEQCEGKPSYEDILHLKYLDMVISESLRKWPPAMFTDRKCVKSYTIEPETEKEVRIKVDKGTNVWIPIFGIQRDEKYYPNPEKFDPERFNDENKGNINNLTYLPFGLGPRNCIGSRFALLETKIILYNILTNFEIVPIEETILPIKLSPKGLNPAPEGGFTLGLKRRTK